MTATRIAAKSRRKPNDKTDRSKELAIPVLAATPDYEKAAKILEVTPGTIYAWLRDPDFAAAVECQRGRVVDQALAKLQAYATKAVDVLADLLDNKTPQIRRGAANDLLSHLVRIREHTDLNGRIAELERKLEAGGKL
jgi:hypothetical protein